MDEIKDLKEEVDILKKRLSVIEGRENRRRAFSYFKIIVKILLMEFLIWLKIKSKVLIHLKEVNCEKETLFIINIFNYIFNIILYLCFFNVQWN